MNSRDRRAIRIGAALAVTLLGLRGVPLVLRWEAGLRERVAVLRERMRRLDEEVAALPRLEAEARAVRERLVAIAPSVVRADAPDAAQQEIRIVLLREATHAGLLVLAIQFARDSARREVLHPVRAALRLEGDAAGLERLLVRLTQSDPLIVVTALQVTAPPEPHGPDTPERLLIAVDTESWWMEGSRASP